MPQKRPKQTSVGVTLAGSLREEMDTLIGQFLREPIAMAGGGAPSTLPVDVRETEKAFVVVSSLPPGVRREDVEVAVFSDTLKILGQSKVEEDN
jgi:HSP20 family molecular chaperone IbpA